MDSALTLIVMLIVVVGCDWLAVTRIAAYYSDFDYSYWPLSRGRQLGVTGLLIATADTWLLTGTSKRVLLLVACVLLFVGWGVTAVRDVNRQRVAGYREPPRYSEADN